MLSNKLRPQQPLVSDPQRTDPHLPLPAPECTDPPTQSAPELSCPDVAAHVTWLEEEPELASDSPLLAAAPMGRIG